MDGFNASRDLKPEDFKCFSKQCLGDVERAKRSLSQAEADLKRAQDSAEYWRSALDNAERYCAKHGVSLYAV